MFHLGNDLFQPALGANQMRPGMFPKGAITEERTEHYSPHPSPLPGHSMVHLQTTSGGTSSLQSLPTHHSLISASLPATFPRGSWRGEFGSPPQGGITPLGGKNLGMDALPYPIA